MEETDAIESLYQEIASLDYHWESLIPTSDILQTLQDPLTFDSEVWTQLIPSRLSPCQQEESFLVDLSGNQSVYTNQPVITFLGKSKHYD